MPVPASISSNQTGLAIAEETSLKVLPGAPVWRGQEPNSYPDFGATLASVSREPINATRQKAKGTVTDLDAKAGFNSDFTQRNMTRLMQGFFFADAFEKPATQPLNGAPVVITSVTAAPNKYHAAAGLNAFVTGHLVKAKGFGLSANNGLKVVTAIDPTFITTTSAVAAEATPPAAAELEAVGFQFAAGDVGLTIVGNHVILTSAAVNPTELDLAVGEWVYVGGDGAGNFFATGTRFFGRVASVTATQIMFDLVLGGVPLADAGALKTLQIFFGKTIMNAVDPSDIVRRTYTIERSLGNDGSGVQGEYVRGSVPNEITINVPQANKATIDLSFVGMDVDYVDGATGLDGSGTRVGALSEDPFNTSSDIVAQKLSVIDPATSMPTALFGYATEAKITIKNGVTPNKALAVIGAFEANVGNFDVSGTLAAYFSSVGAVEAVRNNKDVCYTLAFAKRNAGIIIDIPLLGLGGGSIKVEKDKAIFTDLTQAAAKNPNGYTAAMSFFEYLPDAAMA